MPTSKENYLVSAASDGVMQADGDADGNAFDPNAPIVQDGLYARAN